MIRRRPEVADVFRSFRATYFETAGQSATGAQRRVLNDICLCRSAALGGHKTRCDRCDHEVVSYNSCRNRHCPKCQGAARAEWLDAREDDLLDVPYFHVVFTLPHTLGPLALQNKRLIYGLLFQAASQTLLTIARDPKHLGADVGFIVVMHSWGQTLTHHPHVHAVVPGGGLSLDRSRWISCRNGFFLPVRVLSKFFRNKFLALLRAAFKGGKLSFDGQLKDLSYPDRWVRFVRTLQEVNWVVYAKPPFGGHEQVLKYLARYTHRVAISNRRLVSVDDGNVTFRWKDYAQNRRPRTMTLDANEFIRRFLLHVLPKSFVRIRSYGFLSNRVRKERLALCRRLLGSPNPSRDSSDDNISVPTTLELTESALTCPACQKGRLVRVETIKPQQPGFDEVAAVQAFDTS